MKRDSNSTKTNVYFASKEGYIFTDLGLAIDEDEVKAISNLETPSYKPQVQRLLGMVNCLSKFIHNLSKLTVPLRNMLKKNTDFIWVGMKNKIALSQK